MSGNEHIKIKKIILNQFAKDTQLNTVLKSALKSGIAFQIKGNFKERELNCRQFGSNR